MSSFLYLLVLVPTVLGSGSSPIWNPWNWWTSDGWSNWYNIYQQQGIIRDVSEYVVPKSFLEITYGGQNIYPGNVLYPKDTVLAPEIAWYCNKKKFYHLIFIDLDTLTANNGKHYLIWRVDNIANCDLSTGQNIRPYHPPLAPVGTGPHRCVALLFESDTYSQGNFVGNTVQGTVGAINFNTRDYIKRYDGAVAGNFFILKSVILGDTKLTPGLSDLS